MQLIEDYAYFPLSKVTDLENLQTIHVDVWIVESKLKLSDFDKIEVGGKIYE